MPPPPNLRSINQVIKSGDNMTLPAINPDKISSKELLVTINAYRMDENENAIRLNDFNARIIDELDNEHYESFVVQNPNNTQSIYYYLNQDQAMLVGMRESKAVRKRVLSWIKSLNAPKVEAFQIPATLSEALQLAADQAKQLELQAPKVEFVDNYVASNDTKCLSDVAKLLNIPRNKFCKKLQDDNILFKRDGNYRPYQRYEQYFTMKTGNNGDRAWIQCRVNPEGITYLSKRYGMGEGK